MRRVLVLIGFLVLCYGAAALGGWLTLPGLPWLETLKKPEFNPPSWVFGPVWTALYTMMAVSGWFAYEAKPSTRWLSMLLFGTQLGLNVTWSLLFFYLRQPGWSLVEIVVLLIAIWTYVGFHAAISRTAAWLFVPYGLWVGFATLLNFELWRLNR